MGLSDVSNAARTGLNAAKANISTTGHNIANANTEGFSRQRIHQEAIAPRKTTIKGDYIGRGVNFQPPERINDEYIEKQVRGGARDLAHFEEKGLSLQHVEDIFNEMNGDGLNRLMSRLFNEFRKLSNDPNSQAVRESVREASKSVVNDFKRVHKELEESAHHIDSRITSHIKEVNELASQIAELNSRIRVNEISKNVTADLNDQRDVALKKLMQLTDITTTLDENDTVNVAIRGAGPLVTGVTAEKLHVDRTKENSEGKIENALDIYADYKPAPLTNKMTGGKIGALLQVRDETISGAMKRLDELAFNLTRSINQIHRQGFTRNGAQGVNFFKDLPDAHRASEFLEISDQVLNSSDNIAAAAQANSPGDNRISIAISGLQGLRLMDEGKTTFDDFYNGIVSDVGVLKSSNNASLNQQRNINTQLTKMRDQVSGVSMDEETANLLQFQHAYDASAKVIQVAEKMLDSILEIMK